MKKTIVLLTTIFMMLFSFAALAEPIVMYANQDSVNVYIEKNTSSKVCKTYNGGNSILVEVIDGDWVGVLVELKGEDGQDMGWIPQKDLSFSVPSKYCSHEWTDWRVSEQATCMSSGSKVRECTLCGKKDIQEVSRLEHSFGEWTVTTEASCTHEGEKTRKCSSCGREEYETIPRSEHKYGNWETIKQATCTEEGRQKRTCQDCGFVEEAVVDKIPHTYGPYTTKKNPTCTEEGAREHKCSVCGFTESEVLPKLPHSFEWKITKPETDHSSGEKSQVCKVCQAKGEVVSFDPEGTIRRGDSSENVAKMQQLLIDQGYLSEGGADGIFGGGTEKALMEFQLDKKLSPDGVCWPQTMKKLEHHFGEWKIVSRVDRAHDGEKVRKCTECGFEEHEYITSTPSIYIKDRGENVRMVQKMLNHLEFDAGSEDGIYGPKLDAAYVEFAKSINREFKPERLFPKDIDDLTNAWIASLTDEDLGDSEDMDRPVVLAMVVKQVKDEKDTLVYDWTLTNLGDEECTLNAILLNFKEDNSFKKDNIVLDIDGKTLKLGKENAVSGTFEINKNWNKKAEEAFITAIASSNPTGLKWFGNTVSVDLTSD